MGDMRRGNAVFEQMYGGLMRGLMPKMPTMPQQMGMGGYGGMAKTNPKWNYSRPQRFATNTNLKNFLMQYSAYGKRTIKTGKTNNLLKF